MITEPSSGKLNLKGQPRRDFRPGGENNLSLLSRAFEHDGMIPEKYTCDGENINPPLEISNVPDTAQSLALIVHDPDAPIHGGWTHWTLWNIDPGVTVIEENSVPEGAMQGMTNFGQPGYGGPCPPRASLAESGRVDDASLRVEAGPSEGVHHYQFFLFALDTRLSLDENATQEDLNHAMHGHVISQVTLIGLYKRK